MGLPYFPLYVTDYEADTAHLTLEEDGVYMRLLRLCWRTPGCSIPNEPKWIARHMRVTWEDFERVVAPILSEFFKIKASRYYSPRLLDEAEKASVAHERRKLAGSKGGSAKALKYNKIAPSKAKAMLQQPEPEPEPYILPLCAAIATQPVSSQKFDEFWQTYPHRNGAKKGKAPAKKKWDSAVKAGAKPDEIIAASKRYKNDAAVQRGYAKDPATWLNQRGWEDDIETEGGAAPKAADMPPEHIARLIRVGAIRGITSEAALNAIKAGAITKAECHKAGLHL